jgi:DNA-directed RNA polymerase specialized sigma24 family protein
LYDYLARLVGDRDQAARLLDTVFMRVPGAAPGFQARESVRGGLYSMAREAGLEWLRQRGWLDGLPPSDEAIAPGLQGDVWRAARAMPAFFRAVLITEELHPLSPTEKARALGVNRTDLPRLIDEARRSFNRIYDAQARAEGRPTSEQINPDTVWNARRRLPVEGGSLFGFLPVIPLPDSLKDQIRRHVVEAVTPGAARPTQVEQGGGGGGGRGIGRRGSGDNVGCRYSSTGSSSAPTAATTTTARGGGATRAASSPAARAAHAAICGTVSCGETDGWFYRFADDGDWRVDWDCLGAADLRGRLFVDTKSRQALHHERKSAQRRNSSAIAADERVCCISIGPRNRSRQELDSN